MAKKTDKFSFEELANRELLKQYNTLLKENKSLQAQLDNRERVSDKNLKDFRSSVEEMMDLLDSLDMAFDAADHLKELTDKNLASYTIEELNNELQNLPDYLDKMNITVAKKFRKLLEKVMDIRL